MRTITDNRGIQNSDRCDVEIAYCDPFRAEETVLRKYAARSITLLTQPHTLEDGRVIPPRLSANDCYVALEEACRKMARVALRKFNSGLSARGVTFEEALPAMFPDAPAYLSRCIRSVISDAERLARRDPPTISMDQPINGGLSDGGAALCLRDTFQVTDPEVQPELYVLDRSERAEFRRALITGLQKIPKNYLAALQRDLDRERERQNGVRVSPESDKDRQTVCRARAALGEILKRECGLDNPFVRLLAQQRNHRVRQKATSSPNWTRERQHELFNRLLTSPWSERAPAASTEGDVEEAVVNDVSSAANAAPPTPEMRQAMRVMDMYSLDDNPKATNAEAQKLYDAAQSARRKGNLEEAISLFKQAYSLDSGFYAALSETGVLLSQAGNLRDALKIYLSIIDHPESGPHRFIAATNAADIYLTWFDAGRNREKNIERATYYARLAMEKPTPMRACNLILAYVKDRYYPDAQRVMDTILRANAPECSAEKFLQTLFQIRDADLVSWWNWLDGEMGKDPTR